MSPATGIGHKTSFWRAITAAFLLSVLGSVLYAGFDPLFSGSTLGRLLIAVLSLCSITWLLHESGTRTGRASGLLLWLLLTGLIWFFAPSMSLYLLAHVTVFWLYRSTITYVGVLPAIADLALNILSLCAGAWAADQTSSLFLTLWCFFLVQALYVFIPREVRARPAPDADQQADRFGHAHANAEAALVRLSRQTS